MERIPQKMEEKQNKCSLQLLAGLFTFPNGEQIPFKRFKLFETHVSAEANLYGDVYREIQIQDVFNLRYNKIQNVLAFEFTSIWGFSYQVMKDQNVKTQLQSSVDESSITKAVTYFNKKKTILKYENILLSSDDYNCLNPGKELNDNVVDFYMAYLKNIYFGTGRKDVWFYNSHFYHVIKKDDFRSAKRIPRVSVDIFSKDFLFFPIVEKRHWTLVIVCYPRVKPLREKERKTCILYCDSLRRFEHAFSIVHRIRHYLTLRTLLALTEEDRKKKKKRESVLFTNTNMPIHMCKLDMQKNSIDCGVFMLSFLDYFLRNKPKEFPVCKNILTDENVHSNRYFIQDLILRLSKKKITV